MNGIRYFLFSDTKPTGKCLLCGKEFPKNKDGSVSKKLKYCSEKCNTAYYEHNNPTGVHNRIIRERDGKCELCGYIEDRNDIHSKPLAVHHKKPLADGGEPFPADDGYELLCSDCHMMRHREINAKKKQDKPIESAQLLLNVEQP